MGTHGEFVKFMSKHFVPLSVEYETIENGKVKCTNTTVLSGWILELHDRWFWVTAGHCLNDLNEPQKKGFIRVVTTGFMDYLAQGAQHWETVPFTYDPEDALYLWELELALDFALIPLSDIYRAAFAKNNISPVGRANWESQHRLTFTAFQMLGIPKDRVRLTQKGDGTATITVQPTMMSLEQISFQDALDACTNPPPRSEDWFFGRIHPDTGDQMVEGMSGGPIYGFRKDTEGNTRYHVVALQSWWDPKKRVVFGCSVPYFAERVYQLMK